MNKIFLCGVLLLTGAVALQWQGMLLDAKQAQVAETVHAMQRQNNAQTAKIERLKIWLGEFKNSPEEGLLEELVREKLFMIKPGETYVLPQSEAT